MAELSAAGPVWVGPEFGQGVLGDKRVLLVSLREPLAPPEIPRVGRGFDARLTPKYIDGTMKHQTFTDVARLVLGGPVERRVCESFWRGVGFANLPGPSAGSRAQPKLSEDELEAGGTELASLMDRLTPELVIVFDALLADALLSREPGASALRARTGDWITLPHPGAPGFSFRDHMSPVRELLERAELRRSTAHG